MACSQTPTPTSHTDTHSHTHTSGLPHSSRTGLDNTTTRQEAQLQRSPETIPHFNESPVSPCLRWSAQRDCICETITLSQSKEAAFKWSVEALSGANNHSSLSHCVTEVLNPPFVLHITCLSIDCLVLHFRHLDGHAFKGVPRPWGYASCEQISTEQHFQNHFSSTQLDMLK